MIQSKTSIWKWQSWKIYIQCCTKVMCHCLAICLQRLHGWIVLHDILNFGLCTGALAPCVYTSCLLTLLYIAGKENLISNILSQTTILQHCYSGFILIILISMTYLTKSASCLYRTPRQFTIHPLCPLCTTLLYCRCSLQCWKSDRGFQNLRITFEEMVLCIQPLKVGPWLQTYAHSTKIRVITGFVIAFCEGSFNTGDCRKQV